MMIPLFCFALADGSDRDQKPSMITNRFLRMIVNVWIIALTVKLKYEKVIDNITDVNCLFRIFGEGLHLQLPDRSEKGLHHSLPE